MPRTADYETTPVSEHRRQWYERHAAFKKLVDEAPGTFGSKLYGELLAMQSFMMGVLGDLEWYEEWNE